MTTTISPTTWVFAIIRNSGGNEQLVGFKDESGLKYIPILKDKDSAEIFMTYMQREPGTKYEVQAIIYEDVANYSSANHFSIYVVDKNGAIIEKI